MWRNKLTVEGVNFTLTAAGLRFLAKTITHTWLSVWYQSCFMMAKGFASWAGELTGISLGFWILASLSSVHVIHCRMAASFPEMIDELSIWILQLDKTSIPPNCRLALNATRASSYCSRWNEAMPNLRRAFGSIGLSSMALWASLLDSACLSSFCRARAR